jgi:hypothetical protein
MRPELRMQLLIIDSFREITVIVKFASGRMSQSIFVPDGVLVYTWKCDA